MCSVVRVHTHSCGGQRPSCGSQFFPFYPVRPMYAQELNSGYQARKRQMALCTEPSSRPQTYSVSSTPPPPHLTVKIVYGEKEAQPGILARQEDLRNSGQVAYGLK